MKIFIIPATYNEKGNIEKLIDIIENEVFPNIKNHDMQILVADDNSPDGTGEIVKELMKKYKNLDLNSGEKKGLGAAYIRAMSYAIEEKGADMVISIDADLQFDPHMIPIFIEKMEKGFDIVTGTRYTEGGSMPENWPFKRKLFSVCGNLFVRFITGRFYLHDWTGGFRAYKKDVFLKEREKLRPYSGYTFQVAALYKATLDKYKIGEVPTHFYDRKLGNSKIAPLEYIVNLLRYVITERIRELLSGSFGKFLVVGGLGFVINLSLYWFLAKHANFNLVIANTIGAEIAIFSNYNLNNLWTFSHHRITHPVKYLIRMALFFITSNIGVFIWQNGTIFVGDHLFGRSLYLIYWLFGTGLLLIWNFTIYSRFIWKSAK